MMYSFPADSNQGAIPPYDQFEVTVIAPNMVGRMTAKQKVAGSDHTPDGFSACTLLAVVGFVGTWGEGLGEE